MDPERSSMGLISVPHSSQLGLPPLKKEFWWRLAKVTRHFKGGGGAPFQIACPDSTCGSRLAPVWPVDLSKYPGRGRPKDAQLFNYLHLILFSTPLALQTEIEFPSPAHRGLGDSRSSH